MPALHLVPGAAPRPADPLLARAQRLWPCSDYLQREWLRAVRQVRRTPRGWLLDQPVPNLRSLP